MKFYNRYYNSCYDELLTYYPDFYKNICEMNGILSTFGKFSDDLENIIEQTYLNNFILAADADTIKIWENILHITYNESLSLQQRRQVIIGYLCGGRHMGEPEIRSIIGSYTGNPVNIDFSEGSVRLMIDGGVFDETNLLNTLRQKLPAHLALDMNVKIRRPGTVNIVRKCGVYCLSHIRAGRIEQELDYE